MIVIGIIVVKSFVVDFVKLVLLPKSSRNKYTILQVDTENFYNIFLVLRYEIRKYIEVIGVSSEG